MQCHVTVDAECTKDTCPFWTVDGCAFAKLDFAGRDDLARWLNILRLTFSEPVASPAGGQPRASRSFHRVLASGKE